MYIYTYIPSQCTSWFIGFPPMGHFFTPKSQVVEVPTNEPIRQCILFTKQVLVPVPATFQEASVMAVQLP